VFSDNLLDRSSVNPLLQVEGLDRLVSQQTATISAQHETIKAAITRIAELEGRMGVMEGNLGSCKNTHHLLSRKGNKLTYEMFALQDGVCHRARFSTLLFDHFLYELLLPTNTRSRTYDFLIFRTLSSSFSFLL